MADCLYNCVLFECYNHPLMDLYSVYDSSVLHYTYSCAVFRSSAKNSNDINSVNVLEDIRPYNRCPLSRSATTAVVCTQLQILSFNSVYQYLFN